METLLPTHLEVKKETSGWEVIVGTWNHKGNVVNVVRL